MAYSGKLADLIKSVTEQAQTNSRRYLGEAGAQPIPGLNTPGTEGNGIPGFPGPGIPGLPQQQMPQQIPQQFPMYQGGLLSMLAQRMAGLPQGGMPQQGMPQQAPQPSGLLGFSPARFQGLPTGGPSPSAGLSSAAPIGDRMVAINSNRMFK